VAPNPRGRTFRSRCRCRSQWAAAADGYPFRWYVSPWRRGEPDAGRQRRPASAAVDLASVRARAASASTQRPRPGPRRRPTGKDRLAPADEHTRDQAAHARRRRCRRASSRCGRRLQAPLWDGPAVWVHGDLSGENLLVRDAGSAGVIDWGGLIGGDRRRADCGVEPVRSRKPRRLPRRARLRRRRDVVAERAWAASAAIQALPYYLRHESRHRGAVVAAGGGPRGSGRTCVARA